LNITAGIENKQDFYHLLVFNNAIENIVISVGRYSYFIDPIEIFSYASRIRKYR
jgi:hypothetical protein